VALDTVKQLAAGEMVNLQEDIKPNYDFLKSGSRLRGQRPG